MKFKVSFISLLMILAMVLAACPAPAAPAPAADEPAESSDDAAAEESAADDSEADAGGDGVQLEFWHAMSGELGELVDELVARFNDSQDGIMVTATHQGSYDDTYNALLAAMETVATMIASSFLLCVTTILTIRVWSLWPSTAAHLFSIITWTC